MLHSLLRSQQQPKWTRTVGSKLKEEIRRFRPKWTRNVGSKLKEDFWRFWNAVQTSYYFPRPSLRSDGEERSALLQGNGASRISSRSSGYKARGSQTPDLGTVRESAGSRGFFLHGRSPSCAAHPLQPAGVVLSTGRAAQFSSCVASFDAANTANGRPARTAKRLADNAAQPSTLQVLLDSPCQLAHSAVVYTLP